MNSPKELRSRLFERLSSARGVADKFGAGGSSAMATTVMFSNSPPSSASHQRWTTALVESGNSDNASMTNNRARVRKKSTTILRPVSPFEIPSPDHSINEKSDRNMVENRTTLSNFDKHGAELIENSQEIQKSLGLLDSKIGHLETMILHLMERFPLPQSPAIEAQSSPSQV